MTKDALATLKRAVRRVYCDLQEQESRELKFCVYKEGDRKLSVLFKLEKQAQEMLVFTSVGDEEVLIQSYISECINELMLLANNLKQFVKSAKESYVIALLKEWQDKTKGLLEKLNSKEFKNYVNRFFKHYELFSVECKNAKIKLNMYHKKDLKKFEKEKKAFRTFYMDATETTHRFETRENIEISLFTLSAYSLIDDDNLYNIVKALEF